MTEEWFKSNIKKYLPEIELYTFGNVFFGRFKGLNDVALIRYIKSKEELTLPFDIDLNEDKQIIPVNEKNDYTNGWYEDLLFYEESYKVIKQMSKLHKKYKELMCTIKKNELEKDFV
jgi:hypothetical protein